MSPGRGLVFLMMGLPVGFILSAPGFAVTGREITAPALVPYAVFVAVVIGVSATIWKRKT